MTLGLAVGIVSIITGTILIIKAMKMNSTCSQQGLSGGGGRPQSAPQPRSTPPPLPPCPAPRAPAERGAAFPGSGVLPAAGKVLGDSLAPPGLSVTASPTPCSSWGHGVVGNRAAGGGLLGLAGLREGSGGAAAAGVGQDTWVLAGGAGCHVGVQDSVP